MRRLLYQQYIGVEKVADFFSTKKYLHTARFAKWHELKQLTSPIVDGGHLFLAEGIFRHVLKVSPTAIQPELANLLLVGKTRSGKGLNIETHLLTWPYSCIVNDIKGELYERTAGFRKDGLGGKVFVIDPRGRGARYDPLEGFSTDFEFQSAAATFLYRPDEGQNALFTDGAITMLEQIFHAAHREGERLLPFTLKIMDEGFVGAATILEIISQKHNVHPNLATRFLDVDFNHANFDDRYLRSCWGTVTRRMRRILTQESVKCFTGSDFSAKDIITASCPASVYLILPERHLVGLAPLIQLIHTSLFDGMLNTYDELKGKGCQRVLAVLDEIFRTGMPHLAEYATTVCGRNISLLISAQSIRQMDVAFGNVHKADVLRGQMDSTIFYRPAPADNETAEYIEKALGYTSGFARSKTDHTGGTSMGESEQRVPLMPAHQIKRLGSEEVIGFHTGLLPFRARRMDWRRFPILAKRRGMKPPPIPVLPPAGASFQSRYKPAPSRKLNLTPLALPVADDSSWRLKFSSKRD